jgi:hypothetical protein
MDANAMLHHQAKSIWRDQGYRLSLQAAQGAAGCENRSGPQGWRCGHRKLLIQRGRELQKALASKVQLPDQVMYRGHAIVRSWAGHGLSVLDYCYLMSLSRRSIRSNS